jgi:hypothetical protein
VSDKVVHCKKAPFDVYIGRPSEWGNPFVIGIDGSREEVIQKYRQRIEENRDTITHVRVKLRGKILGCWCAPAPCHGDVLAEIANAALPAEGRAEEGDRLTRSAAHPRKRRGGERC